MIRPVAVDDVRDEVAGERPLFRLLPGGPQQVALEIDQRPTRTKRLPSFGTGQPPLRAIGFSPLRAAELILVVLLALQCARLFWTLVTPLGPIGAWSSRPNLPPAPTIQARPLDFDPFFRISSRQGPIQVTSLELTLYGVREDRATGGGSAIIGHPDGAQQSYVIGEEILPGVILTAVAFDSVTISNNGSSEQIFLASGASPDEPLPGSTSDGQVNRAETTGQGQ